jgi:hypothetical protein
LQPSIGVKTRSGSEVSVDVMSPPLCCRTTKYDSVKQTFWTPRQQYSSDLVWNLCHTFMMIWCGFVQTWGNPKECCFRTKTCGHHLCRETWLYQTISTYIHTYIYIFETCCISISYFWEGHDQTQSCQEMKKEHLSPGALFCSMPSTSRKSDLCGARGTNRTYKSLVICRIRLVTCRII